MILYILLCGYPPFYSKKQEDLYKKIKKATFTFPEDDWSDISDQAKDLISHMMDPVPDRRFTAEQCYHHLWIQSNTHTKPLNNAVMMKLEKFHVQNKLKVSMWEFISIYVYSNKEKQDMLYEF